MYSMLMYNYIPPAGEQNVSAKYRSVRGSDIIPLLSFGVGGGRGGTALYNRPGPIMAL